MKITPKIKEKPLIYHEDSEARTKIEMMFELHNRNSKVLVWRLVQGLRRAKNS